jgi:hypothetical protein
VTLDHIDPMCSLSLSSVHIGMHTSILYLGLILYDFGSYLVSFAYPCSHECHSSVSILCDVVFSLCLCERWSSIHRDVR